MGQWLASSSGERGYVMGFSVGLRCCQVEHLMVAVARSTVVREVHVVEPTRSLYACHYCHFSQGLIE